MYLSCSTELFSNDVPGKVWLLAFGLLVGNGMAFSFLRSNS